MLGVESPADTSLALLDSTTFRKLYVEGLIMMHDDIDCSFSDCVCVAICISSAAVVAVNGEGFAHHPRKICIQIVIVHWTPGVSSE